MVDVSSQQPEYKFIIWEMDTTGSFLYDEFFHMTCFYGTYKYDVYVMPHRNISDFTQFKYEVCTARIGKFRYLMSKRKGTVIATKTEYAGLRGFLFWLKKFADRPIVLTTYESYQYASFILIAALERYGMLEEFQQMVHGFVHAYSFVSKKCRNSMSSLKLNSLARVLLNGINTRRQDSYMRAKLLNEILLHLCDVDSITESIRVLGFELLPYVKPVVQVINDMHNKANKVRLQISLKPIFSPFFKEEETRNKALIMRKQLTEVNLDYNRLDNMWKNMATDQFKSSLDGLLKNMPLKTREDIIAFLVLYFESVYLPVENIEAQEQPQANC